MKNTNKNKLFGRIFAALVLITSMVLTLSSCYQNPNDHQEGIETETDPPQINISSELDLPPYMKDLVLLDELFKYYSFDGLDEQTMKAAILKAYIEATGDDYAEYLDAEEYEEYFSERAGEFVGVGVSVVNTVITVDGRQYKVLQVISVFKDSPALEAGVKVGDCVAYVGSGDNKTLVDVLGYTMAIESIRGTEGTPAEFTVFRPSGNGYEEIEFSVERKTIHSDSVSYKVSETDSKIGIVNVLEFDDTTPRQFTNAVDTLMAQGCDKFVFDLRDNPGGGLDSIETVLSFFLNKGDLIVSVEYSDARSAANFSDYVRVKRYGEPYEGLNVSNEDIGKYKDLDCVVLVNENSASAAELFTATFRDYSIAKIVGTNTFGKGSMQTLFPLDSYGIEGGLKLTVARYFSKSHTDYHGIGIQPDVYVELSEEALEYNIFLLPEDKDDQLQAAIAELKK